MIARMMEAFRSRMVRGGRLLRTWRETLAKPWSRLSRQRASPAYEAGRWGEEVAERYLRKKGYRILARRVRLSPRDELDLVARHHDVLVFVEVKTRRSEDFGRPIAAVNAPKRRAMARAALRYVGRLKQKPDYLRFDVVEIVGTPLAGTPTIRHTESCFTLGRSHRIPW